MGVLGFEVVVESGEVVVVDGAAVAGGVPKVTTSPSRVSSRPRLALRLVSRSSILSAVLPVAAAGAPVDLLKKTGIMVP